MSKKNKIISWIGVMLIYGCGCVAGYSICHKLPVAVPILNLLVSIIADGLVVWSHNA